MASTYSPIILHSPKYLSCLHSKYKITMEYHDNNHTAICEWFLSLSSALAFGWAAADWNDSDEGGYNGVGRPSQRTNRQIASTNYKLSHIIFVSSDTSAFFLIPSAQATASLLPFSTSTQNQMTSEAQKHNAKRKGKPIQLLPDLSMIAWMTLGPIMDEARFESPKRPKNC